ncbi:MAG: nucleotide exchange factor GrpE [Acidobacteriota bacterium]
MSPSESEKAELDMNEEEKEKVESLTASEDPLVRAEAELKEARTESAEWQDRFLRKAAEFENFRKRTEKEKAESAILAKSSLLQEFLPIADAFERALESMDQGKGVLNELDQYHEGVELLYKQLLDTLGRIGVVPIESEGKPFDPHLHEALSRKENPDYEEDTVIQELRRGYLFKDRLLRPAQVIVAFNPEAEDKES